MYTIEHKRTRVIRASQLEGTLFFATFMILAWIVVFILFGNKPQTQSAPIAEAIILCYKLGFAGSMYFVAVPVIRLFARMTVRLYHYPITFIGLLVMFRTGAALVRSENLMNMPYVLMIPLLAVPLVNLWVHNNKKDFDAMLLEQSE